MTQKKSLGLQAGFTVDQFLEAAVSKSCPLDIYLHNGVCLKGIIRSFCGDSVFLVGKTEQTLHRRWISSLVLHDDWTAGLPLPNNTLMTPRSIRISEG